MSRRYFFSHSSTPSFLFSPHRSSSYTSPSSPPSFFIVLLLRIYLLIRLIIFTLPFHQFLLISSSSSFLSAYSFLLHISPPFLLLPNTPSLLISFLLPPLLLLPPTSPLSNLSSPHLHSRHLRNLRINSCLVPALRVWLSLLSTYSEIDVSLI